MIVYKDRTWCSNAQCVNYNCSRYYTEAEQRLNNRNLPVMFADFKRDGCGYKTDEAS